jgi:hypothetical protein
MATAALETFPDVYCLTCFAFLMRLLASQYQHAAIIVVCRPVRLCSCTADLCLNMRMQKASQHSLRACAAISAKSQSSTALSHGGLMVRGFPTRAVPTDGKASLRVGIPLGWCSFGVVRFHRVYSGF